MSTKQIPKEYVTEHYCDICGKVISDGSYNGGGEINFWGQYLRMKRGEEREIVLKTKPFSFNEGIIMEISYGFRSEYMREFCNSCAEDIKSFVEYRRIKMSNADPTQLTLDEQLIADSVEEDE